jgi:hypothetical protein
MEVKSKPRGAMVEVPCDYCGGMFKARVADRKRGWGKFCSKSSKGFVAGTVRGDIGFEDQGDAKPVSSPEAAVIDMSQCERIDWTEISRRGLLRRINTEIMHPLGLAVYRDTETGVSGGALVSPDGSWRYPDEVNVPAKPSPVSRAGWKWYGFAGHHICSERCVYHLTTAIHGRYLVSTVGRFIPDPLR